MFIVRFSIVVLLSGLINTRNEWTCLHTLLWSSNSETLAKTFTIPDRKDEFCRENNFNNAVAHQTAIAMNTNSAFTGFYTEYSFCYQQLDLREIKIITRGQPNVDFDGADNCGLYVTTKKAMNFRDDVPSLRIENFEDHFVLVFDLTSMQDVTEILHYPQLFGNH